MKKLIGLFLAAVMLFAVSACAKPGESVNLKSMDDTSNGGSAQVNSNLKDISLAKEGKGLKMVLHFVSGSEGTTDSEQEITGLPEYTLSFLPAPARMVLTVNDLRFWDYQKNSEVKDETGLVLGLFKLLPINQRTSTSLYFNLSSNVGYTVTEEAGKLSVYLEPKETKAEDKHYVTGNLFYEYQEGVLPDSAGLTPTLSNDGTSVIMISQPMATADEANTLMQSLKQDYLASLEGKDLSVLQMKTNALPAYNSEIDYEALNSRKIIRRNGAEEAHEVFFPGARLLVWRYDGAYALFAKSTTEATAEGTPTEELYLVSKDGVKTLLFDYDLALIYFAEFSRDGSKILIVEQINELQIMSIYDLNTKNMLVVDDTTLGNVITGACFSEDGKYVYAMAGDEMLLLRQIDTATGEISSLTFSPGVDTGVYCVGKKLYYMDVVDDEEWVVSYDLEADSVDKLVQADFFLMSDNGQYIVMQQAKAHSDDWVTEISVFDIETGTKTLLDSNLQITNYFFSLDSKKLFYVADLDEEGSAYYSSVFRYNIAEKTTEKLFDSVNAVFEASNTTDEIVLCARFDSKENDLPVTYLIPLN